MKRLTLVALLCFTLVPITSASADWRWVPPKIKPHKVTYSCATLKCIHNTYVREKKRLAHKIRIHDKHRLAEWKRWTRMPIPTCTWYGESGFGPQFARYRYTLPNSQGSGALGKYQLMPGTYAANAKYGDWSPLDQEIAGHRENHKHGTQPWTNCTG
jgi:hypothetical protein